MTSPDSREGGQAEALPEALAATNPRAAGSPEALAESTARSAGGDNSHHLNPPAFAGKFRWWALAALSMGTFTSVVGVGGLQIAVPTIATHFHATLTAAQWVALGYAVANMVFLLPMGRLGDMIGRQRVFFGGILVFLSGAALGAAATNIGMVVVSSLIQGAAAAMLQSTTLVGTVSLFPPHQRGQALGITSLVVGFSAVCGPVVGGVVVGTFGWRSLFLVNMAIGLITLALAWTILRRQPLPLDRPSGPRPPFDFPGALLSSAALLLVLFVITNGTRLGWSSPWIITSGASGMATFAVFIWHELRIPQPMLQLRLFRNPIVALSSASIVLFYCGWNSTLFLMPFYLQRVRGFDPRDVGLFIIPNFACLAVFGWVAGRLSDRIGWRRLIPAGLVMGGASMFIYALFLTTHSPAILVIFSMMLFSAGHGMFNPPTTSSVFSAVTHEQYGVVSALLQLIRNGGNTIGIALSTTIVVMTMQSQGFPPSLDAVTGGGDPIATAFVAGLRRAYWVIGALIVGAMLFTMWKLRASPAKPKLKETSHARP